MPPKKGRGEPKDGAAKEHPSKTHPANHDGDKNKSEAVPPPSKKRKTNKTGAREDSKQEPRRSGRNVSRSQPSKTELLDFMLSKQAADLCRPDEEFSDIAAGKTKTYTDSVMNPFEELLCAVILSRPISHRLGLRTIRTIFNNPYNFNSAKAVQKAGHEKHLKAVYDARTQHKDKTAAEIGLVADVVLEKFTSTTDKDGTQMRKLLDDNDGDVDKALDELQRSIKGFGATGSKIFLRRVQWLWSDGYAYIDDRTQNALRKLGLPDDANKLEKLLVDHWSDIDKTGLPGANDKEKQRRAFVTILERAIGADLEGKVDDLLQHAAKN